MLVIALLHRASQAAGRALNDVCLFALFLLGLAARAVWRWA